MSERVSLRELARRLDHNPGYIHKLKSRGVLEFGEDGKIDHDEAIASIARARDPKKEYMKEVNAEQRAQHRGGQASSEQYVQPSSNSTLYKAKAARELYEAKIAELKYKERAEELVDALEVEQAQFAMARQIRDRLQSIPDRIGAIVAAESDALKVTEILEEEIRRALIELSAQPAETIN